MKGNCFKQKRALELKKKGLTWAVIAIRLGYSSAAVAKMAARRYEKNG